MNVLKTHSITSHDDLRGSLYKYDLCDESCHSENFLEEHISAVDDIVNGEGLERILNKYENGDISAGTTCIICVIVANISLRKSTII